jgi:hypothetical protein
MMAGRPIYRDHLGNLARRFEGRVGSFLAGEISAWQNNQRQFLSGLISSEKQRRLDGIAKKLGEARGDALRKIAQELHQELVAMDAEISMSAPEQGRRFREVTAVIEGLVQRVLNNELPVERDIVAELRSRNIPKFPEDQRSIPRKNRVDPLEFLREHYGEFLVYFGASQNQISQSHLGEVDPVLIVSIRNRVNYLVRKQGWDTELREIVPPYSEFLTQQLEGVPRDRLLVSAQLGHALQTRERRAKK